MSACHGLWLFDRTKNNAPAYTQWLTEMNWTGGLCLAGWLITR